MITKKILMFIGMAIIFHTAHAQYSIKGAVSDEKQNALEFVHISLLQNDSLMSQTMTDSLGKFQFDNTATGLYNITLEYWGKTKTQSLAVTDSDRTLNIAFDSITQYLSGVTVEGKKPVIERRIDRLLFNVENSIVANSGDALDVLKITPNVRVQNEVISMIGKGSVAVMINDRIIQLSGSDLSNYLKTISADNIKRIEVITTPPSKYDAQGNSGLINIVLKTAKQNSWNNNIRTTYNQTTYPSLAIGNTFAYNKSKLRILISVDGKTGHEAVMEDSKIFYPNNMWNQSNLRKDKKDFISGYGGIDYKISKKSSIGVQYSGGYVTPDITDKYNADIYATSSLVSQIHSGGKTNAAKKISSLNLHYLQEIDTLGRKFSIDFDYFNYRIHRDRNFASEEMLPDGTPVANSFFSANNISSQNINNYSFKIDFEHPAKWINFTYGLKTSFTNTNNEVNFYNTTDGYPVYDPTQSDIFKYSENTQAVYFDAAKELTKKWETKIGLRIENTQTTGKSISYSYSNRNNYIKLFPTFYLLYKIDENNTTNFNYSKRIGRPAFWELNPFRWYLNAVSYAEGNPFLQPQFINNFELSHTYKSIFFTTLSFSIINNGFSQVPSINPQTHQQIFTRKNYFNQYLYGFSESYTFDKFAWWQSSNQFSLNYSQTVFTKNVYTIPQSGFSLTLSSDNAFIITKDKSLEGVINFWYTTGNKDLLYINSSSYCLDFGVRKYLINRKLECILLVNDIFKSSNPKATTFTNDIKQIYYVNYDSQSFRIVFRYRLGNDNISNNSRNRGNEDELNRARSN